MVRGSGVLSSRRVAQTRADVEAYRWWARGLTLVEVAERVGYADASGAQRAVARVEALCEVVGARYSSGLVRRRFGTR